MQFTKVQHDRVMALRQCGFAEDIICQLAFDTPIDRKTLRKYFARELQVGIADADSKVVYALFAQAVGAPAEYYTKEDEARTGVPAGTVKRAEQPRVPSCGIWWTKARLGWKDSTRHELTGKDGAPLIDLSKLTDAELDIYEKLVRKSSPQPGPNPGGTDETRH